jgi:hypothetical protein
MLAYYHFAYCGAAPFFLPLSRDICEKAKLSEPQVDHLNDIRDEIARQGMQQLHRILSRLRIF